MSVELPDTMKQQAASLTLQEKAQLAIFLNEQVMQSTKEQSKNDDDASDQKEIKRQKNMEWLKTHWEEYRGFYVALDGGRLVGQGVTIREASEQAKQKKVKSPLLVRVPKEGEAIYSAW